MNRQYTFGQEFIGRRESMQKQPQFGQQAEPGEADSMREFMEAELKEHSETNEEDRYTPVASLLKLSA